MGLTTSSSAARWNSASPVSVVRTLFEERDAQLAPDGTWVAYHSNQSGQNEAYMHPFPGAGERVRVSTNSGVQARCARMAARCSTSRWMAV